VLRHPAHTLQGVAARKEFKSIQPAAMEALNGLRSDYFICVDAGTGRVCRCAVHATESGASVVAATVACIP
jgi:hypothetical protein